MKLSAMVLLSMRMLLLVAAMLYISAGVAVASDSLALTESQPSTMYYTTNGAAITWTGGGLDTLASNPANWSGSAAPQDGDAVVYDGTSSKDSVWNSYALLASISLNQGYTGITKVNSLLPVSGKITLTSGELAVSRTIIICPSGGNSPPYAPGALSATLASFSRIDLSWTDNSYNEEGFKIERKIGSEGTFDLLTVAGADTATYSDTGLTVGTTYHYRVWAYNSVGGSSYSNEANATVAVLPTVATAAPSAINGTSAILAATTNPNSVETTTFFEWGPTTSYGSSTSAYSVGSGTGNVTVSDSLTGLTPATTYHYRAVASSANGTVYGSDLTFTTSTITLSIDSPSDSGTISRPDVLVTGTVTNPGGYETGVTVNGVVAVVYGNQFAANHVPLQEGANVITVTATDTNGNTSTASVMVTATTTGEYVRLTADTESGAAPLSTTLRIDGSFSIANSTLSSSGPVQPDIATVSATQYQVNMTAEGMYFFTASVTGPDQNQYQDTIAVVAMNSATVGSLLQGKWNAMTTSLSNQDVTTALTYICPASRAVYQQMFTAIVDQLPAIIPTQSEFNFISIRDGQAKYELVTTENGKIYSYEVIFSKDSAGLWRIKDF